jgi:hypothetical protein
LDGITLSRWTFVACLVEKPLRNSLYNFMRVSTLYYVKKTTTGSSTLNRIWKNTKTTNKEIEVYYNIGLGIG